MAESKNDIRQLVIDNLKVLRKQEQDQKQGFKVAAYNRVIKQLEETRTPFYTIDDFDVIKGVGKSIRDKIDEIIEAGFTERTREAMDKSSETAKNLAAIELFMGIMAIGPVKAKELVDEHGFMTIEELRNHQDILNDKQRMGLKYYEPFMLRIPRAEMLKHYEYIGDVIRNIDDNLEFEMTGSFRRGLKDSGDIDILITHKKNSHHDPVESFQRVIKTLQSKKYLIDDFAFGEKKYNGVCRLPRHKNPRRIDIMYTEPERYPFALLYFTGSQDFNIRMRNRAIELGYSLNEYGLKPIGAKKDVCIDQPFYTEKSVFKFLGMDWVEPIHR